MLQSGVKMNRGRGCCYVFLRCENDSVAVSDGEVWNGMEMENGDIRGISRPLLKIVVTTESSIV